MWLGYVVVLWYVVAKEDLVGSLLLAYFFLRLEKQIERNSVKVRNEKEKVFFFGGFDYSARC
jgi:hypothetical protein